MRRGQKLLSYYPESVYMRGFTWGYSLGGAPP